MFRTSTVNKHIKHQRLLRTWITENQNLFAQVLPAHEKLETGKMEVGKSHSVVL